jgi:hypothetical protein
VLLIVGDMSDESEGKVSESGGGMINGFWDAEFGEDGVKQGLVNIGLDDWLGPHSPSESVLPFKATKGSGCVC